MHERSVAKNLLNIVLEKANVDGRQHKIKQIRIVVGEFSMICDELLVNAFYQLSQKTVASGATIEIMHLSLEGECQNCKKVFKLNKKDFKCPYCSSRLIQIISGDELYVEDIQVSESDCR